MHITPNNKVYIGQTKHNENPSIRWNNGKAYKNNKYFDNAIKKYGWENIKHVILKKDIKDSEIDELERKYIQMYKSNIPEYGYNLDTGGTSNKSHSEETKKKISESEKGKFVSDETRRKISESKVGNKNSLGRVVSKEQREKIRKSLKGKYASENSPRSIPIIMVDIKTKEYLMEFSCARDAAKYLGNVNTQSHIRECCRGLRKTCCGYMWIQKP